PAAWQNPRPESPRPAAWRARRSASAHRRPDWNSCARRAAGAMPRQAWAGWSVCEACRATCWRGAWSCDPASNSLWTAGWLLSASVEDAEEIPVGQGSRTVAQCLLGRTDGRNGGVGMAGAGGGMAAQPWHRGSAVEAADQLVE